MARQLEERARRSSCSPCSTPWRRPAPEREARPTGLSEKTLLAALAQDLAGLAGKAVPLPEDLESSPLWRTFRANFRAVQSYEPGSWSGRAVLLRASGQPLAARLGPRLGWDGLAPGLEVRELPGEHYTLLRPPAVDTLAAYFRSHLAARG